MAEDTPLTSEQVEKFNEALAAFVDSQDEAKLREMFTLFDRDGNGTVTARELRAALSSIDGTDIPVTECQELVNEADTNKDGVVDINEFIEGMKKFLEG